MRSITVCGRQVVRRFGCVAAIALMLSACISGPPVQEMSDARQAISAAREAGAEHAAVDELRAAEAYLDSAEQKLTDKSYSQARRDALLAKDKALEALAGAEAAGQNHNPQ